MKLSDRSLRVLRVVLLLLAGLGTPLQTPSVHAAGPDLTVLKIAIQTRSDADLLRGVAVGKSFAGICVARLVLQNKLNLDAPLTSYIPELYGSFVGPMTIRQIGLHSAQLTNQFVNSADRGTNPIQRS